MIGVWASRKRPLLMQLEAKHDLNRESDSYS